MHQEDSWALYAQRAQIHVRLCDVGYLFIYLSMCQLSQNRTTLAFRNRGVKRMEKQF